MACYANHLHGLPWLNSVQVGAIVIVIPLLLEQVGTIIIPSLQMGRLRLGELSARW